MPQNDFPKTTAACFRGILGILLVSESITGWLGLEGTFRDHLVQHQDCRYNSSNSRDFSISSEFCYLQGRKRLSSKNGHPCMLDFPMLGSLFANFHRMSGFFSLCSDHLLLVNQKYDSMFYAKIQ